MQEENEVSLIELAAVRFLATSKGIVEICATRLGEEERRTRDKRRKSFRR